MDMAEFLRGCGYVVHEAATAEEAIEALQAIFLIDLVFTDINLSEGIMDSNWPSGLCIIGPA
jgi:CheY-like chemotaxis protein